MVVDACKAGNQQVIADVKRIAQYDGGDPLSNPKDLCGQLFHTVYMGMSKQSSKETRSRAEELAREIGGKYSHLFPYYMKRRDYCVTL